MKDETLTTEDDLVNDWCLYERNAYAIRKHAKLFPIDKRYQDWDKSPDFPSDFFFEMFALPLEYVATILYH